MVALFGILCWILVFLVIDWDPNLPGIVLAGVPAAVAIYYIHIWQRNRVRDAFRRWYMDLEALRQTSLQLTSTLELKPVLNVILDQALQLMDADDAHVFLYDGTRLHFGAAVWGGEYHEHPYKEPGPNGVTYTVARSGQPLLVSSDQPHPHFPEWDGKAVAGFPLRIGTEIRGVMNVAFEKPHIFDEHELQVMGFLADQAALAIQNAQLYEAARQDAANQERRVAERTAELTQAQNRQAALVAGLRSVLTTVNELITCGELDNLLRRAVELARENLGVERCAIFLLDGNDMVGTYGTDMQGQTTDEHANRFAWSLDATPLAWRQPLSQAGPQWVSTYGTYHTWDGNEQLAVGHGWICGTPIQSSTDLIGYFANDAAISGAPLDEMRQEIIAVYCSLIGKIIERKQIEEDIRRALQKEKDLGELRSRFVSMISHEFRTPLAVILSSAQLLQMYGDRMGEAGIAQRWAEIDRQIKTMTGLLEDVLTIGKAESGGFSFSPAPLDIHAFCEALAEEIQLASASTHHLAFTCQGDEPTRLADERLLQLTLNNLLMNAVKYSPDGSRIDLDVACEDERVIIRVQDRGIGIQERDQAHLFDLFYRGRNVDMVPGTGLGLSIASRAVETQGGRISFESQVGVGTTFTVILPLRPVVMDVNETASV